MTPTLVPATLGSLTLEHLDRTLGVFFIGYIFCLTLYGFTFFQSYVYFSRYPNDSVYIRTTVGVLCALDTASSALVSHALYYYLVKLFPFTQTLEYTTNTFSAHFIISIVAVCLAQVFYAHRVFAASKNTIITGIIDFLSVIGCALGLVTGGKLITNHAFADLSKPFPHVINSIAQAAVALSGLAIFASMSYFLRPSPETNVKPFVSLWDKLIAFTVSRGGTSIIFQFACFISFAVAPTDVFWIFFHLISTKLFVVSVLTMLNCREVTNGHGVYEEDVSNSSTRVMGMNTSTGDGSRSGDIRFYRPQAGTLNIEITRNVYAEPGTKSVHFEDGGAVFNPVDSYPPSTTSFRDEQFSAKEKGVAEYTA